MSKEPKDRLVIGIIYSKEKQARLKSFCSLIGEHVSNFTAQALDNEIEACIDNMEPEKKKAVMALLKSAP